MTNSETEWLERLTNAIEEQTKAIDRIGNILDSRFSWQMEKHDEYEREEKIRKAILKAQIEKNKKEEEEGFE